MLIDEPHVIRDAVCTTGARPTHPGADELITTYADAIDAYAAEFKAVADEAWSATGTHEVPYGTPADVLEDEPAAEDDDQDAADELAAAAR
jgi:hypothetical protein